MDQANAAAGIRRNLTAYGDPEFSLYLRRAFLAASGYDEADLNRPIIGIVDTSSDYSTCHRGMSEQVQAVKRGILEAGGLPFAFPTISLHEILTSPTTMLFRNLMAMATEEMIRAQPMDAVVLLGGCDKTVPAHLMAAASADIPALVCVAGPMMTASWEGQRLGACTDCRRHWASFRAGQISPHDLNKLESSLCSTAGTCPVMGTASTMACLTEALGMMLPGGATPPAVSGDRLRHAVQSGRQAVALAQSGLRPSQILTRPAFENALAVLIALGGSTNAIVHLMAIAGRVGIDLSLDALHAVASRVPLLVDCKPAGIGYMEDFHKAGGLPVLMKEIAPRLDLSVTGVSGRTLGEDLADVPAPGKWQTTIRTLAEPLGPTGSLATVKGSLAPDGAVIKAAAASSTLMTHRGPAVVFESPEDVAARIDDPRLGITAEHVLVMRHGGPVAAGMPEAGALPIPKYLAQAGVTDMVRVSDARMSGTAYGTVVLHVSPEAACGGPLALVRDGDLIELDVAARRLDLLVPEAELAKRAEGRRAPALPERGWARLYRETVLQAHEGADLDFLAGKGGAR
jgi:dihydroxy-acid dehydratase